MEAILKEKLSGHQEKGEVVKCPSKYRSSNLKVETFDCEKLVILATTLPSDYSQCLECKVDANGDSR